MEKVVKQYILSNVFKYVRDIQVMENRVHNGFSVGSPMIHSSVFERLIDLREYLAAHNVAWYVTSDEYPSYQFELPCIRFYDTVSE